MDDPQAQPAAIIYCRVSSKDQLEGTSLDTQERMAKEYADRQGLKVLKVFVERGESAKTANRTEFNQALAFCSNKKNAVKFFVVYKLDRFARNQDDHVTVRALLKKYGAELRSVTEPIDETPIGRAMEGVLSVFAEFDNNVRTERTKGGMLERVKQGMWMWPTPLGYYRPAKGANMAPDPHVAPLIRLGFEEFSKGIYTYKAIANFLAERGLKTRYGKKPIGQLMEKILKNPVYCGVIKVWGEHQGTFEPIVSKELFLRCQDGYKEANHLAPRSANNPLFPLRGSVCEACGSSITGSSSTSREGKKLPYYHHIKYQCEKARWIPKGKFEQAFKDHLEEITPTGKYEKMFKAVVMDTWQSNYKKLDEQNALVRNEIAKLEQDRQKVFDFHRSGKYSDDEFAEQKNQVNSAINQKRLFAQETWVQEFDMEEALNYCFKYVRATSKTWTELDYGEKLQFQKMIFKEKIKFDGEKFGNTKLSLIYQPKAASDGGIDGVVELNTTRGIRYSHW